MPGRDNTRSAGKGVEDGDVVRTVMGCIAILRLPIDSNHGGVR